MTGLPAKFLLITTLLGFLMGEVLAYTTVRFADGNPSFSVQDLMLQFTGGYGSQLENKLYGSMRPYIPSVRALDSFDNWIMNGLTKDGFEQEIRPILRESCMGCHRNGGKASFRALTNYEELTAVAMKNPSPSLPEQLNFTKVHVLAIGLMLALVSAIWARVPVNPFFRNLVIVLAFIGLFVDFGSWWGMHLHLNFAWGRIIGHVLFASAFLVMVIGGLFVATNLQKRSS